MATVQLSTVGEAVAFAADQATARSAIGAMDAATPILSANAITAIAALTGASTTAQIVTALQTP